MTVRFGDRYDSPVLSDFPTDPPPNHDAFLWLLLTLFLVALAVALVMVFKRAERRGGTSAIDERARAVMKFLAPGAKAPLHDQIDMAIKSRAAIESQFGETLKFSNALAKITSQLNSAVEGTEKKAYKPQRPAMTSAPGSTIINIAVNSHSDGSPVAAAGGVTPADPIAEKPAKVPMSPEEQRTAVWFAVQKLFDYWKNLLVVTESYRAALRQLSDSPPWEPPVEDPRLVVRKQRPS